MLSRTDSLLLYGEGRTLGDRYLNWLSWVLMGYALMGRGFAYLGVPPLFIGETTAAFGLLTLLYSGSAWAALRMPTAKLLIALALWSLICTVPYVPVYGISALRDTVIWSYSLFAFVVAGLLFQKPIRLRHLLVRYRRFGLVFIGVIWAIFLVVKTSYESIPKLPGTNVTFIDAKGGDILVHISGFMAFMIVGMVRARLPVLLLLGLNGVVVGIASRAGTVSFALSILVVLLLRPPGAIAKLRRVFIGLCVGILLLAIANPTITVKGRAISVQQLWENVSSIAGTDEDQHLEGTREWRLLWWAKIIDYTFNGPYFWTGKGFGVGLGESDGFANLSRTHVLRSPHNGHMTMLARAGVLGFVLWLLLQSTWLGYMLKSYFAAKKAEDFAWSGVFLFLIAYWTAFMANTTFDVYLEGPMGGIWFWTLFGVGMASTQIYKRAPEVLWDDYYAAVHEQAYAHASHEETV